MDKEAIKKKMDDVSGQIVANSKDAKFAKKLISQLLSLKGQYDVEEVLFIVRTKDVIKEYDNDNLVIVKCKDRIMWKHKGGFGFWVETRMKNLYEQLDNLCAMKDKYEELSEEEKSVYNGMYFGMSLVTELPMFVCASEEMFFNVVNMILEELKKINVGIDNAELQDETPEENADFEAKMQAAEEVTKDGGSK